MATQAKGDGAAGNGTVGEGAETPRKPARSRKSAAARVATKTARAAKRQAKKTGKLPADATVPASSARKPAAPSAPRTTSAAKRKAAATARGGAKAKGATGEGILARSLGKVRGAFSRAASSLSAFVRPKTRPKG